MSGTEERAPRTERVRVDADEHVVLDRSRRVPGAAPWVLFLHGMGSHRRGGKITALTRHLDDRGTAWAAYDARGHGESDGRVRDWTPRRHLAEVAAVVAHLRAEWSAGPLVLAGSSLGGWAAAWHAALDPAAAAALFLVAPAFRIVERYWERLGPEVRARWKRDGVIKLLGASVELELTYRCVEEVADFPHERLLRQASRPTWIVHGARDEAVPVQVSRDFAAQVPRVRLQEIPDGDHRLASHHPTLARALDAVLAAAAAAGPGQDPVLS